MTTFPSQVLLDTEKHLTDAPEPLNVIWQRVNCWSEKSVRAALDHLVDVGKAECGTSSSFSRGNVTGRKTYRRVITPNVQHPKLLA